MRIVFAGFLLSLMAHGAPTFKHYNHNQLVQKVKNEGPLVVGVHKKRAFDSQLPMTQRWQSFMVYTQVRGKKSLPEIKRALTSKTWFMRSAGLMAMEKISIQSAKQWAYQKLMADPALMVRMKALEILQKSMDEKVITLFWSKLYASDSFHQNKSLWIRQDIAQQLAKKPRKKDLKKWIKLLHEEKQDLQNVAAQALAKMNKVSHPQGQATSYWLKKYPSKKL